MAQPVRATYRLQLRPGFGFAAAGAVVPYLESLGISHIYLSPVLRARTGSTHGYDVVDPSKLNPALGTDDEFAQLAALCAARGMALVLDIVPNHMAASEENLWWWDVLLKGSESGFARFFDIDWERGAGRLVLPVLGRPFDEALESGEITVRFEADGAVVAYFDRTFPLNGNSFEGTPPTRSLSQEQLRALLSRQNYRLEHWKLASTLVNYRRFFDINDLAAVRVEDDDVFNAVHGLTGRLAAMDGVGGVRVDHIDGLLDPSAYLDRLRRLVGPDCRIWVEKILGWDEALPPEWPVDGTTGYEVGAWIDRVLVDGAGVRQLDVAYTAIVGARESFREMVFDAKLEVVDGLFAGELARLAGLLAKLPGPDGAAPSAQSIGAALALFTAGLPCYRTYITGRGLSEQDRVMLERARATALRRGGDDTAVDFIVAALTGAPDDPRKLEFARRWQQFSGPVAAKGLEDTALYRDTLLLALDAVGRSPGEQIELPSVSEFHASMQHRAMAWPHALSASSTHDSKRSEDVRYRVAVLSELPAAWRKEMGRWRRLNADCQRIAGGAPVPDDATEWGLYQTLLGTWPVEGEPDAAYVTRLQGYAVKAAREAGLATSWHEVNETHEKALEAWIADVLDSRRAEFRAAFAAFAKRVAWHGALNSLSGAVLKLALPGVPDIYQGTEAGSFRLVDPDSRAPVDFRSLEEARRDVADIPDGPAWWRSNLLPGRAKLRVVADGLTVRGDFAELLTAPAYEGLEVRGDRANDVLALARSTGADAVVAIVPRFTAALCRTGVLPLGSRTWGDTAIVLPKGYPAEFKRRIGAPGAVAADEGLLRVGDVLVHAPVALLASR